MDAESWTHVLHELGTIIAAAAGAIAAVSSLKNGRTLKNGGHIKRVPTRKRAKKKTASGEPGEHGQDWFSPPDLGSTK